MNTTTFQGFRITAVYLGDKAAPWDGPENWNNHRVTVSKAGRRATFTYWGSIMHPEVRSDSDLRQAFACLLSDAAAGEQDFEEFCADFGCDADSRTAERTWKACQRAAAKVRRLLAGADLYELQQQLYEAETIE